MPTLDVIKKWMPSVIFNAAEIAIIYLLGMMIGIPPAFAICIMLTWTFARLLIGKPKHYKSWQKCLLWTTLLFLSLFVLAGADFLLCLLSAAFCAFILSGRADIRDFSMWKPKGESKYQREIDHVKYNPIDPNLIAFEEMLRQEGDNLTYMCYKYIFKDGKSWQEAADRLETETYKLTPVVEKVAFGIRLSCKI